MLQAEVGSAKITNEHSYPQRGRLMRDFTLLSTDGKAMSLYDYRGRANLVVVFAGDVGRSMRTDFLAELVSRYTEIRKHDAEVLLVAACSREQAPEQAAEIQHEIEPPFPVLVDKDMQIHQSVGALVQTGASAVYVTDRFLEVFAAWRTSEGNNIPSIPEILSWLDFVSSQCPECTQSEWPTDE